MAKEINKHKEIMDRLRAEGKVRAFTKEDYQSIEEINKRIRERKAKQKAPDYSKCKPCK